MRALAGLHREVLMDAAALSARYRLRTADAIQLATGLRAGATLAVTNDAGWQRLPGMEILLLSDVT